MSAPRTSSATRNVISSPVSADGGSPPASPAGPTSASFGPARRRANPSRWPAQAADSMILGTYGPSSFASSVPPGLLSWWESRFRERLSWVGSIGCTLIWKASVTPAGRLLSRLVPSTPRISADESGMWPTPTAVELGNSIESYQAMKANMASGPRAAITSLKHAAMSAAPWPTPTAMDGNRGSLPPRPWDTGIPLSQKVAMWATPCERDYRFPNSADSQERRNTGNNRGQQLVNEAAHLGPMPSGSLAPTEKPGALNPEFVSWLMGYPAEWLFAAPANKARPRFRKSTGTTGSPLSKPSEMRSSRKSRQK